MVRLYKELWSCKHSTACGALSHDQTQCPCTAWLQPRLCLRHKLPPLGSALQAQHRPLGTICRFRVSLRPACITAGCLPACWLTPPYSSHAAIRHLFPTPPRLHSCMCVCVYTYIYMYTYIYTYTHVYTVSTCMHTHLLCHCVR